MICAGCGGLVVWRGLIINLTHTQCLRCERINCQIQEEEAYAEDEEGVSMTTTDPGSIRKEFFAGQWSETGHVNYGKDGGGYKFRHTMLPRLSIIDRTKRRPERQWFVDGVEVADLHTAIDALAVPPVFTDEESALLARLPDEWDNSRDVRCEMAGLDPATAPWVIDLDDPRQPIMLLMHWLTAKGAIVHDGKKWRKANG